MSETKISTLNDILKTPAGRNIILRFISSLEDFVPPLYVGETGNLHVRIQKHLNGLTTFGNTISSHNALNWDSLKLTYCPIADPAINDDDDIDETAGIVKQRRQLFEMIASTLGISGFGRRIG